MSLFNQVISPSFALCVQKAPARAVLASTLAVASIYFSIIPTWASFVTRYADYAPKDSAVFLEFRGEDDDYKAFMKDAMNSTFFKDLLSGNLLDLGNDNSDLLPPGAMLPNSISPQTQQTLANINSLNKNVFTATKIFFNISQKLVEDFEVAGAATLWIESPHPQKVAKKRTRKQEEAKDISLSSTIFLALEKSKPHFFVAFTLRPGKTIDGLIKKWDLQAPKTIPYHAKNSEIPLTLYFYQTGPNNKVSFYFFQHGEDLYVTDSLESVQSMLQAQAGNGLAQSTKLSKIVPALPSVRQGTFILQAPPEFQSDLIRIGSKIKAELTAPRERKETDEQYTERQNVLTLFNKFWPLVEIADATAMSYELQKTPNTEKAYRFISRLYVQPNWNKITDPSLKADLLAGVTPKTQTSFSRVVPEGVLFSMGAYNLSAPYYLTTKHIIPLLPEKASQGLLQTQLGLGLMGLDLEKDLVGLFDNLTGIAVNRFDFGHGDLQNIQATVFLNGNATGQAGSKNLIKTAQDIYKDTEHFSDITLAAKPAKRIVLPYREHGVRKQLPLLVATPAPDVLAFGTETMVRQLPGLGSGLKAIGDTETFKSLAEGLPNVPLAYAYIDYHQYFGFLNDMATWAEKQYDTHKATKQVKPTSAVVPIAGGSEAAEAKPSAQLAQSKRLFKTLSHFYGPGSILLSEGYYDQTKGIFALDSRFTLVMTEEMPADVVDIPQIKPSKPSPKASRSTRRRR
jgi:hypothetical protein